MATTGKLFTVQEELENYNETEGTDMTMVQEMEDWSWEIEMQTNSGSE